MRIAHVQPYDHAVAGGVREHVVNLARHHRALGHDVTIIATASDPRTAGPDVELISGAGMVAVPAAKSIARVPLSPWVWWRVRRLVGSGRFDVVHVHEPLLPMVAMAATVHARAVTVGTIHGYRPRFILYRAFRGPLERIIGRLSGRVAVSIDARDWISRYFPGQYHVIPDGVDVARFSDPSIQPIERYRDGRPTVLFVGRLEPRKGFPVMLDAWARVQERIPDARLVVVGHFDDAARDRWQATIDRAGLQGVELEGFVSEEELPRYYRSADVFCAPSTGYEALGIVLLEAMAAGVAVVTTDIEGYRTVVRPGIEAVVVPPSDPEALAGGLVRVLGDASLRAQLVEAGRQRVAEYAWPRLARRLVALYESLGAGGGSSTEARTQALALVGELAAPLGVDPAELQEPVQLIDLGLDSLALAELSSALEDRTGVRFDDPDLAPLRSVRDLIDLLVVRAVPAVAE